MKDKDVPKPDKRINPWHYVLLGVVFLTLFLISLGICFWKQLKDCLFPRKPGEPNTLVKGIYSMTIKTIDSDTGNPIPSKRSPEKSLKTNVSQTSGKNRLEFVSYNQFLLILLKPRRVVPKLESSLQNNCPKRSRKVLRFQRLLKKFRRKHKNKRNKLSTLLFIFIFNKIFAFLLKILFLFEKTIYF